MEGSPTQCTGGRDAGLFGEGNRIVSMSEPLEARPGVQHGPDEDQTIPGRMPASARLRLHPASEWRPRNRT